MLAAENPDVTWPLATGHAVAKTGTSLEIPWEAGIADSTIPAQAAAQRRGDITAPPLGIGGDDHRGVHTREITLVAFDAGAHQRPGVAGSVAVDAFLQGFAAGVERDQRQLPVAETKVVGLEHAAGGIAQLRGIHAIVHLRIHLQSVSAGGVRQELPEAGALRRFWLSSRFWYPDSTMGTAATPRERVAAPAPA